MAVNAILECSANEAIPEASDQELLQRFIARREEAAFARLVQRHGRTVWGVCRRVLGQEQDAEDAFQAVFLVLARKPAAIRRREAVGSWLYSVAYRTAMKARQSVARRRDTTVQGRDIQAKGEEPWGQAACRELQRMLDEELQGLAEKYRAPFVLCCLEGMSKVEAAQELGWKEGTVSSRLAQARKLLHTRLARRGVALSAVLTAGALAQSSALAAAPAALLQGTVQAVLAPAATSAAGAGLSPSAVALAEGLLHSLAVAKVKAGLSLVAATGVLLAGATIAAVQMEPAPAQQKIEAEVALSDPETFLQPGVPLWPSIDEQVLAVAISPDGSKVITAGARHTKPGQLMIWDAATGKALAKHRGIRGTRSAALSPDGKTLATGEFGGAIKLRDPDTGEERAQLKGHTIGVNSLAFAPDGQSLVSAGLDRIAKLWNLSNLKEQQAFRGHTDMILCVAFFGHGKAFVTGGRDKLAKVWDVESGKEKFTLPAHPQEVEAVAVSPDDKLVVTGCWDGTIRLWDAETGEAKGELVAPGEPHGLVLALAFAPPDGKLLASGMGQGAVLLWDVAARKLDRTVGKHGSGAWALAFSPDGKSLVSGSSDRTAKLWDLTGAKEPATFDAGTHSDLPIHALAYSPDGKTVAIAPHEEAVLLRDAQTGALLHVMTGLGGVATCVAFSPDGQSLAGGCSDQTIKIWDAATGKATVTLKGHEGPVHALVFTSDGKKLASAGDDQTIRWWDPVSGKELATLKTSHGPVRSLALAPDGHTLASGASDGTIELWDLTREAEPTALNAHTGAVRALAFAASGSLASAGDDALVKVWSPAQGKETFTLKGHQGEVWTLAFSPGGRTLASGGPRDVIIWDAALGQRRAVLKGHQNRVSALAMHPRGEHLLSASHDATVLRWGAALSTAPPLTLQGNPKGVWFAQFSPAGDRLASGGLEGDVTLWTRTLTPAQAPFHVRNGIYWDVAFSPDGQTFAIGGHKELLIFDGLTGQVKHTVPFGEPVCTVAFSPDGRYLAAGTGNWQKPEATPDCRLFETAGWTELAKLTGHASRLFRLQFSPDSKLLATSSRDKTIRLWEVPSGQARGVLQGHKGPAKGMVFLPNGTLVSAGYDSTIRFWNVQEGKQAKQWPAKMVLASLDASPDGTLLAAAESSAETGQPTAPLKVWDVASGKEVLSLTGHSNRILGVAFTRDGRGLVAAGGKHKAYGEINYWDLITGQLRATHKTPAPQWMETAGVSADGRRVISVSVVGMHVWDLDFTHAERTWKAHKHFVSCGLFLDGGRVLATGAWDATVALWDVRKQGGPVAAFKGHKGGVRTLAVLPGGNTMISAGEDKTIKLWDRATGTEKTTLQGNTGIVYALALSPDGKTLASGGGNHRTPGPGELILWDLDTLKPRATIPDIERAIFSLAYSPDGAWLAGSISSGAIKVWDAKTGQLHKTFLVNHARPVTFSPDGKLMIAAGGKAASQTEPGSGKVRIWDTTTWKERRPLPGHENVIFTVDVSPDSSTIATASQDGTVKLWSMPGAAGTSAGTEPVIAAKRVNPAGAVGVNRLVGTGDATGLGSQDGDEATTSLSLKVWLALGTLLFLAIVSAFGLWRLRQARNAPKAPAPAASGKPIHAEAPAGSIAFTCSSCGKQLKTRAELIGKHVKCPKCGKAVTVSEVKSTSATTK
jgi:RNA polymerase sigma factor (sigma-70 family)